MCGLHDKGKKSHFRLPKAVFIVEKELDRSAMEKMAEHKMKELYCVRRENCVDAVAETLIAGGLDELTDYQRWGIPTPGM